jgi:hypothetical protein
MKNSLVFDMGTVLPILDFFQSVLSYVFRTALGTLYNTVCIIWNRFILNCPGGTHMCMQWFEWMGWNN